MHIVLVSGIPASGKTTFAKELSRRKNMLYISKDEVKEILFDAVGFASRQEKVALGDASINMVYYFAERIMARGLPLIIENNFENHSAEGIRRLIREYAYSPVTVMFGGDPDVLYRRFIERNRSPERHPGHITNTKYQKGSATPQAGEDDITLEYFKMGIVERGMLDFQLGRLIRVDTTDFRNVDYDAIIRELQEIMA